MNRVARLARIRLNCRDPTSLAAFFVRALGFELVPAATGTLDVTSLSLGTSRVDLFRIPPDARDYPGDVPGFSPLFQHFAMAVEDMDAAMARLGRASGWRSISHAGPQRLPLSSGGVVAFKFRDPEGHPLELIRFPKTGAATPHIDHSAISVGDTAISIAFYQDLGLKLGSTWINQGPEQDRLDGLADVRVEVSELLFPGAGPHIELLCYGHQPARATEDLQADDVAATRLVLAGGRDKASGILRDPDGHFLELETGETGD